MRRIVICSDVPYPRGGASANYVQYLSLSLKEAGYAVELLVTKNPEYALQVEAEGGWRGVPVRWFPDLSSGNRVIHHLRTVNLARYYLRKTIASLKLTPDDLVVIYSISVPLFRELLHARKKCGVKLATCPVEHFPKGTFPRKLERLYEAYYEDCLPRMDLLFPISKAIRDYLAPQGKPMLLLPPMADVSEYAPLPKVPGKWNVIFPANGMMKDGLSGMLRAVADLPASLREKMAFHLCGVKSDAVKGLLTPTEQANLDRVLTVHDWMTYSELVDLYRSMHFLFLAREVNQITLSNFPSKVPEVVCYGVVPVVSRVGEYTDGYLADGVNAIVFDGCDRAVCREALSRALSLDWEVYQRLSQGAIALAKEKFDYTVWAPRLRDAIEELWN